MKFPAKIGWLPFRLGSRVYYALLVISLLFLLSYFFDGLFPLAQMALLLLTAAVVFDAIRLFSGRVVCERRLPERLSNGDENPVHLHLRSYYKFPVAGIVFEELPFQLSHYNNRFSFHLNKSIDTITYNLRPKERGLYHFGDTQVFVHTPLRLVMRHFVCAAAAAVKVYPSFLTLRRWSVMAVSNQLQEAGSKRLRKIGSSTEFEQIKEYVPGDDYRTVNWKASARRGDVMVTKYTDERSQQLYFVVNKGRLMKMPFEGLTLLDYSINATLALAQVSLLRSDKAGLITLGRSVDQFLPAEKKGGQIQRIQEVLYALDTDFPEPNLEALYATLRSGVSGRSLVVFFQNYESLEAVRRDLPLLQRMARHHLLLMVLFENTELEALRKKEAATTEDIYVQTIADKFVLEKKAALAELRRHNILAISTQPQQLTPSLINKYFEIKKRHSL